MNVSEAIRARKSVRAFTDAPVEEDKLAAVLEAARLAPSASNRQEWRFVVVRDPGLRKKIGAAAREQTFVGEAPVVLVCCAETDNHTMTCGQQCYPINVAIAMDHMTLTAAELGLGTCWIGAFYEDKVKEILGIPPEIRVVELMPLGYPRDPAPKPKSRKSIEQIVHWDRW